MADTDWSNKVDTSGELLPVVGSDTVNRIASTIIVPFVAWRLELLHVEARSLVEEHLQIS